MCIYSMYLFCIYLQNMTVSCVYLQYASVFGYVACLHNVSVSCVYLQQKFFQVEDVFLIYSCSVYLHVFILKPHVC